MFQICHPSYSNNTVNVGAGMSKVNQFVRFGVAEAFGCVSANHFNVVNLKIKQILNCMSFTYSHNSYSGEDWAITKTEFL